MKIFNTEFEVSMRILILLDCANSWLNDNKIIYLDFFSLYSKTYEIQDENLNGDCSFMINDLTIQRNLYKKSIKELAIDGFIQIKADDTGYSYKINSNGSSLVSKMETEYAMKYKTIAETIIKKFSNYSDERIKEYAKKMEEKSANESY